jgi:hypothetical protein
VVSSRARVVGKRSAGETLKEEEVRGCVGPGEGEWT